MIVVFGDRARMPTDDEVEASLGPAIGLWTALRARLTVDFGTLSEAWAYSGKAYGWSLRLKQRDRPVVYLTPMAGRFRASLALPERAVSSALEAGLPAPIQAIVACAPTYPEGRAVRIEVASEEDVASVVALARIRMAS
jgi:hypothetical protein